MRRQTVVGFGVAATCEKGLTQLRSCRTLLRKLNEQRSNDHASL
ncbi:MAG: hypothetical protein WC313_03135 [Candidatus Kapaibacterium sp.]